MGFVSTLLDCVVLWLLICPSVFALIVRAGKYWMHSRNTRTLDMLISLLATGMVMAPTAVLYGLWKFMSRGFCIKAVDCQKLNPVIGRLAFLPIGIAAAL